MRVNRFILFLVGGIIFMVINSSGCEAQKFEKYYSRDPELSVSMDYFSGWSFNEDRGAYDSYAQVIFLEPVYKGKSPRSSVVFTTIKESKAQFKPLTLAGFFDDRIRKWLIRRKVKVLSQENSKVAGFSANCVELTYEELINPESGAENFILMQERVFLWEKDNQFYTLRYVNTAKEFGKFVSAFDRVVHGIEFKGKH